MGAGVGLDDLPLPVRGGAGVSVALERGLVRDQDVLVLDALRRYLVGDDKRLLVGGTLSVSTVEVEPSSSVTFSNEQEMPSVSSRPPSVTVRLPLANCPPLPSLSMSVSVPSSLS